METGYLVALVAALVVIAGLCVYALAKLFATGE